MPDRPRSGEGPDQRSGSVNPEDRPLEISPAALERLRAAAVPGEFLKIATRSVSGKVLVPYADAEVVRGPSSVEDAGAVEAMPGEPGRPETATPTTPPPGAIESELPSIEIPPTEEPPWTQEETPWPEELPSPETEVIECPEMLGKRPEIETFSLTDLTFDLSAVAHTTPGLLAWEEVPLQRVVNDTYPLRFDEEEDGVPWEEADGQGEEIGEEPPCVRCKLILVYGSTFDPDAKEPDYAIQAAHNAAAMYVEAQEAQPGERCVIAIHVSWKSSERFDAHRYFRNTPEDKYKWVAAGGTGVLEGWLGKEGRKIDCFDVLAIYHGTRQNTDVVLSRIARYCQAPIRNLYLWCCWGSEKIDPANLEVKKELQGVKDLDGTRKLSEKIEELKKPGKSKTELEKAMEALGKVEERLKKCDCYLCLYTAMPLDKAEAEKRLLKVLPDRTTKLEEAVSEWKTQTALNPGGEQQRAADAKLAKAKDEYEAANAAKGVLKSKKTDQYAMPLGIREPKAGAPPLVLLAPEAKMRVYCPLDLGNPMSKDEEITEIFGDKEIVGDVPIEPDDDLIVIGLGR